MNIFEDYLLHIENQEHRALLRTVLQWVKETFPTLEPRVAWNRHVYHWVQRREAAFHRCAGDKRNGAVFR